MSTSQLLEHTETAGRLLVDRGSSGNDRISDGSALLRVSHMTLKKNQRRRGRMLTKRHSIQAPFVVAACEGVCFPPIRVTGIRRMLKLA